MSKKSIDKDAETAQEAFEKLPEEKKQAMRLKGESEKTVGKEGLEVEKKIRKKQS